ncbi:MAG: hypothetical protein ABEJ90_01455 [Halobacterium sp.]
MDLDRHVGESPTGDDARTVEHVTHHRRWSPNGDSTDTCPNCGAEFDLADRHVLVTLTGAARDQSRHYFCGADCVGEWLDADAA